jgi:hypothetical protein
MKREKDEELWLNIGSYPRAGPTNRVHFSPAQVQTVARSAGRTPEVMVKVLSGGATSCKAVRRHLEYIGRKGDVELRTDDGDGIRSREGAGHLPEDWDLDLDEAGATRQLGRGTKAKPPRLVHKLVFSMPPGTNPEKVYTAVQSFCREEFALKHRYVMALHTDEHHPHVHVVLRASDELGKRLNIKKAHLKEWREKFAAHLRDQGVTANATPRTSREAGHKTQRLATYWKERREAAAANPRADSRQDAPAPPKTHEPRVR